MAAEADAADDGAPTADKSKPNRRLLIFGGAAAVVLAGGGASAWFLLSSGRKDEAGPDGHDRPSSFIFNLPSMTVNLRSDGSATDQFMKVTIALEVANEETMQAIQPRMAKVVDAFQVYLRELRKSDLEGSAGIYRLKEELRRRVNVAVYPAQVDAILFKEILVQ